MKCRRFRWYDVFMGIKILVLDDDSVRLAAFNRKYGSRNRVCLTATYPEFRRKLIGEGHWDVVFLDHDLGLTAIEDDCFKFVHGCQEPYNGMDAVTFLASSKDQVGGPLVIVHSLNVPAAIGMEEHLRSCGFSCRRIPFDATNLPELIS